MKATKTQILCFVMIILSLIISLDLMGFMSLNNTLYILLIILMLIVLIFSSIIIIGINRSLHQEEREEKKKLNEYNIKFNLFNSSFDSFDYETADEITKKQFLILNLYKASTISNLMYFYIMAYQFKKEEIKYYLENILDDDFNYFLYNVILNLKLTPYIYKYQSDLLDVLNLMVLNIKKPKDNTFYMDKTKHLKFNIILQNKLYYIEEVHFIPYKDYFYWKKKEIDDIDDIGFRSEAEAYYYLQYQLKDIIYAKVDHSFERTFNLNIEEFKKVMKSFYEKENMPFDIKNINILE